MNADEFLEALLGLPRLWGPQPAPDGTWVAWSWFGTGRGADVYAAPTDGSAPPLRLTETPERTLLVGWTPDSQGVIVQQDHDGNERAQLFRVDLARPGKMLPLTEADPPFYLRGGQLHPNGRWLVYSANYNAERGKEIEPFWVYRHDLRTGDRRVLARPKRAGSRAPQLNEPGTQVLYSRQDRDPAGNQIWLVDIAGRNDREILNFGPATKIFASWLPDGRRVLFLAETPTHRRLGVWRAGRVRWLIDDPARNFEVAFVPRGTDGRLAVLVDVQEARPRASLLDLESGKEMELPALPGNLFPLHPLADGAWVATYWSAQQPDDLVHFLPDAEPALGPTSLTRIWERTALRPADLAPAEDYHWHSVDGRVIQGWLYRAQEPVRGTIVYVHGGPTSHSPDAVNPQIQFFVAQGFHVLDPNYRGSTGFGMAFREAIKEDGWGGREQDDIRTGIEALIAGGIAQPGQVGITGTSYGGYSAWCAITHWPPEVLAASAPICGMTDLLVDYETTRPDLRPYSEEMLGGRPDQVPDRYHERSPIHFVDQIRGRLLIVQGMQDPNVTPENVRAVRAALDAAAVPYEVLAFEDEGHGIVRPANRRVLYRRLVDFFGTAFGT